MSLLDQAKLSQERAYAPYSRFRVGAALKTAEGEIFSGCNVENVAYPEGTCAEAGAIAAMVNGGGGRISEILVISDSTDPVPPCGGCRQKIAEFAAKDATVTMVGREGATRVMTVAELLPGAFDADHLKDGQR